MLNVPISVCLGLSSAAAILYSGTSLTIVATNIYSGISKFLLLAIPFFVLSGNIMAKAGISTRLIRFVDTCVGHRKGGIANVCIIVACFFGAISGSGPATVAALGAVLIPAMVERGGFSAAFSTALMATSSSIAIVIPPSIAFVVYASITGVSIGDMFMAGIIPGILMGLALVVVVMLEVRRNHVVPSTVEKASVKERWNAFKDAFWGFLMPVIILGGIYGGIFTPTEAAAVSVVYGLFVGMIIYKEVKFKDLWEILIDSAKTTGGIMLIVACASLFSFVCTRFGISTAASELLARVAGNQFTFLLICNIIFLIAGCFIDANSAMYIFIPIMLPVCKALQGATSMDRIWYHGNGQPGNWSGNTSGRCQPVCRDRHQIKRRYPRNAAGDFQGSRSDGSRFHCCFTDNYLYSADFDLSAGGTGNAAAIEKWRDSRRRQRNHPRQTMTISTRSAITAI